MKVQVNDSEIELLQGDITENDADAIVNAANSRLILGGGVAGAIARKGGPAIQQECSALGSCPVGEAVVTTGGNLRAKFVIHAVGPKWGEGGEDAKLKSACLHSLKRADEKGLRSIALPALSTGIFGFPLEPAARILLEAAVQHLSGDTGLKSVRFVLFDAESLAIFTNTLQSLEIG